jgi:hypothetical protein
MLPQEVVWLGFYPWRSPRETAQLGVGSSQLDAARVAFRSPLWIFCNLLPNGYSKGAEKGLQPQLSNDQDIDDGAPNYGNRHICPL